jgi:hypothetical protein
MQNVKLKIVESSQRSSCGCQGTRHKLFASCTSCGRIICDAEKGCVQATTTPFACLHCGEPTARQPLTAEQVFALCVDDETVIVYKHKDKLLQFDKENAKRTQVLDSQVVYIMVYFCTWLLFLRLTTTKQVRG